MDLFKGNVGDSRAVLSINGAAEPLSSDHKPGNEEESRRIVAAGGWVEFNRVNGQFILVRFDFYGTYDDSIVVSYCLFFKTSIICLCRKLGIV